MAMVGAIVYGGLPNWNSIKKSWKVSSGVLVAAVIVAIFYITQYGWQAMYETFIDSLFYALIIATFVSGTVKKFFRD